MNKGLSFCSGEIDNLVCEVFIDKKLVIIFIIFIKSIY